MTLQKSLAEWMSPNLITVGWDERMEVAHRRMLTNRLRHLPVHNEHDEIVGMLSNRDVQRAMISEVQHHTATALSSEAIRFDPECRVRDYMAWPVLTVSKDADLRTVIALMLGNRVSAVLVRDGGKAVGILTTDDMLKILAELLVDGEPSQWSLRSMMGGATDHVLLTR